MPEKSFDSLRDPALEAQAAALYSATLPYHNFQHIQEALAAAAKIVGRCRSENIRIDGSVVYYALLFHDAGYHEDHKALGHATKERYSAALAGQVLADYGLNATKRKKTVDAILATEKDANFISAEQKAVRAADLSGMAAPYDEFLVKSLKLKREFEILHERALDWQQWQANSAEIIGFYLKQDIRLTSYFYNENGESQFHTQVADNLRRLLAEPTEPELADTALMS